MSTHPITGVLLEFLLYQNTEESSVVKGYGDRYIVVVLLVDLAVLQATGALGPRFVRGMSDFLHVYENVRVNHEPC